MCMKKDRDAIEYTLFCVNEFARENNLSSADSFSYLDKHKAFDFLVDNYEVESSLALPRTLSGLKKVAARNGGSIT